MGSRKRNRAEAAKEAKKSVSFSTLKSCPTSPRKMRLVADMIRGVEVAKALAMLQYSPKEASTRMGKLLRSAIANWEAKNEGERPEDNHLVVSGVKVDSASMLKRLRPAPQGRGHRIRKRSNHVTLTVDRLTEENLTK